MPGKDVAVLNGNKFETLVENVISEKTGMHSIINSKAKSLENNLIRQYAFETIYGSRGRLDYRLNYKGKTYYIECKYQGGSGSVDEKLPYTLLNIQQHTDGIRIIVIDGAGWRQGALAWLYENADESVEIFNLAEFKEYMNGA